MKKCEPFHHYYQRLKDPLKAGYWRYKCSKCKDVQTHREGKSYAEPSERQS